MALTIIVQNILNATIIVYIIDNCTKNALGFTLTIKIGAVIAANTLIPKLTLEIGIVNIYFVIAGVQAVSALLIWFVLYHLEPGQLPWELGTNFKVTNGSIWNHETFGECILTIQNNGEIKMVSSSSGLLLWET